MSLCGMCQITIFFLGHFSVLEETCFLVWSFPESLAISSTKVQELKMKLIPTRTRMSLTRRYLQDIKNVMSQFIFSYSPFLSCNINRVSEQLLPPM